MKIVVTGSSGLIGWHASVRIHARNCAARFAGDPEPYELVPLDREQYANQDLLAHSLKNADVVLHFAGVNRDPSIDVEAANPRIARELVTACQVAGVTPHIVYANSTHAVSDTAYGRSKRRAAEILVEATSKYTDLVLPHVFGEGARPYYNNVTSTFIDQVIRGEKPTIDPNGMVSLLHAGAAAEHALQAVIGGHIGSIEPESRLTPVPELYERIKSLHASYSTDRIPDLTDEFDLALFNCYRTALYPEEFPRVLEIKRDYRGTLFEAARGGGDGQTFLSWTEPGITRGDHFHLRKVERFLVVRGEALIRIRPVLGRRIWEYRVNGDRPAAVDMPTLHTHSIENIGTEPLLTLFWANEVFDPSAPDTYADPVLGG